MQSTEALPKRSYILYILFILLSSLLILIDYFSNKELSSYFPNSVNFEFELEQCQFCTVIQSRMENPVYCKIFRLNYLRIKHYTEHTDSRKSLFSVKIKR